MNSRKGLEMLVLAMTLAVRAIGGFVGFGGLLLGSRHSQYALFLVSLLLAISAGISLKDSYSPVGEKWRIPIVVVLIFLVLFMAGRRVIT